MTKLRVGIIFGGKSAEHEVSLQSARNIADKIDKNRFEIVLFYINKHGQWYTANVHIEDYLLNINNLTHIAFSYFKPVGSFFVNQKRKLAINTKVIEALEMVDVVFPIIHGTLGEDGSLQGMLQIIGVPFVGSDVLGSAVCMDKDFTKRLLRDAGLKIAPFITVTHSNRNQYSFSDISMYLKIPFFVKPANQGSSIGVSKVTNEKQFINAICLAFEFDQKVIIEAGIQGREIECALLGRRSTPKVSICGEVIINHDYYTYDSKYVSNYDTQIVIPASLNSEINDLINQVVITAYQVLGCYGMARVDVFLTSKNEIVINEINTLPGFTDVSMYPKLWQASGISYTTLISQLIELALERHSYYSDNILKT